MNRCLICGIHVEEPALYHEHCCRELFRQAAPPILPYRMKDINTLAEKAVRRSVVVPGVQPKLSLHLERTQQGAGRLTVIGLEGRFILKPPVAEYPGMPELEHLSMLLAKSFGIPTVPFGLIRLQTGEFTFITRRIDREADGEKIHMEDLCQLSDRLTDQKYKGSMESVGKTILQYASNPILDALRFYEITLFSFLVGNADMHWKNFSLLHRSDGLIVLAPAYDLLATRLLLPSDKEETALAINGKKNRLSQNDFLALGKHLLLNEKQIDNALTRIRHAIPSALNQMENGFVRPEVQRELTNLMQQRARRLFRSHLPESKPE